MNYSDTRLCGVVTFMMKFFSLVADLIRCANLLIQNWIDLKVDVLAQDRADPSMLRDAPR